MVHLLIEGNEFVSDSAIDGFTSWLRDLASYVDQPVHLIEVLENDEGSVVYVIDLEGQDVLVHNIMFRAAYTTPFFAFEDQFLTYQIVSEDNFERPIFIGSFTSVESWYDDTSCGCPDGMCLAEEFSFLSET